MSAEQNPHASFTHDNYAREAAAVTELAVALAGYALDPYTSELLEMIGRGTLTGDQAVEAILKRLLPGQGPQ